MKIYVGGPDSTLQSPTGMLSATEQCKDCM